MGIGNQDTYTYNNFILLPDVFTGGTVILGNQISAGAAFRRFDINGAQISTRPPIESKLEKNELVRFGFRNPRGRLAGFLPPQIPIGNNALAASFDFTILGAMTLWLDSSDQSSVILDGSDRVSEWRDKTGNFNHHTQSNSSRRPYYDVKLNGLNGIRFVNADSTHLDKDDNTGDNLPFLNPPYTIVIVNRQRSTFGAAYGMFEPASSAARGGHLLRQDADADVETEYHFDYRGSSGSARRVIASEDYVLNRTVVISVRTENSLLRNIRHNGVQVNQNLNGGVMTTTLAKKSSIGAYWQSSLPTGGLFMEGEMFEIHVFAEYLSDDTLTFIENTLATKWAITF
jgi:hypothetical protein